MTAKPRLHLCLFLTAGLLGFYLPAIADAPSQNNAVPYIWWEAENAIATNIPTAEQNPYAPEAPWEADALSGGAWVGARWWDAETPFLEYSITVPEAGNYHFYVRRFWYWGSFRWQLNGGEWHTVTRLSKILDRISIRPLLEVNWTEAGKMEIPAGTHTLRIEVLDTVSNKHPHGFIPFAYDAFVLTKQPFIARGKAKPSETFNAAPEGWFAFDPELDTFDAENEAFNLRSLNEAYAGEHGAIRIENGNFIHSNNQQEVRFFGIGTTQDYLYFSHDAMAYHARMLAKRGVNAVRLIIGIKTEEDRAKPEFAWYLNQLHFAVTAFKAQGIYVTLSMDTARIPLNSNKYPDYAGKVPPNTFVFLNKDYAADMRATWQAVLTTPNPHSAQNLPLAKEPALAFIEIINNTSLLTERFSPLRQFPYSLVMPLEESFGNWLIQRYGSLNQALQIWQNNTQETTEPIATITDYIETGRMAIHPVVRLLDANDMRTRDTLRFLAEQQRNFFIGEYDYLKNTLNCQALVSASNHNTNSLHTLAPLNQYTYTIGDYMGRTSEMRAPHTQMDSAIGLASGNFYADRSLLKLEGFYDSTEQNWQEPLPFNAIRYNKLPLVYAEAISYAPNRFRTAFPILNTSYAALQGVQGLYFFGDAYAFWQREVSANSLMTPNNFGQFPALALLYRKAWMPTAKPAAEVTLPLHQAFNLEGSPVLESLYNKYDIPSKLEQTPKPSLKTPLTDKVPAYSVLGGVVDVNFSDTQNYDLKINSEAIQQTENGHLISAQGAIDWDTQVGLFTLSLPQAEAATGFLKDAGKIQLTALEASLNIPYGAVIAVSLDDQPLLESRKILLQIATEETNLGWYAPGQGFRELGSPGNAPLIVRQAEGSIRLKSAHTYTIQTLDINGRIMETLKAEQEFKLRPDVFYYMISR